ncbi:hypothetical protein RB653_009360 [Dictyostelium firmibasis]|uniref:Rad60/SUMO-like domain-containing protein n=1 Tax=Dictyostelium firmibasis TaxID=79012 RepID=A0AAN7U627_9MYCE
MVIKVMENDLGVDFSPNKLLPSPSVHSFWKKMVLNSEWYKEFLRILGSDIHFKLSDKKDLKNPKLRLVLRKKYEHTLQIYSKYFPESSIIQLDKNNKESLWPFNYLLSPSEESDSELESPKKKNSPPITCIPMNISSTFFSSPSAHFSSSYSSSSSSIPMISNNSTPCASLESSPLGSPITSIVRSNSQAETIKIIVDSKTETLFYRVPIKQKFKEILKNFIERNPTLIYFYNDFEVSMLDTPKSLDMEHDDIIEGREEVKEPHQQLV